MSDNPLVQDRTIDFLLYDVCDVEALCALPRFADHSRETFDLFIATCRKLARESLLPSYQPLDAAGTTFADGRIRTHPQMATLFRQLVDVGFLTATRPYAVGGQQLPTAVMLAANTYVCAANLSVQGFCMLTTGAAHLIEAFGEDALRATYMERMYAGDWTGTMALTEPQAGSGLADVQTRATATAGRHYLIRGAKVFISGGDNAFSENVVHLVLARIDGAPAGTKGISLFVVPRLRPEGGALVDNDVTVTGNFHKMGWRALPSVALGFGEREDCHGWLVGEPHMGLRYMFQMMNEARLGVGTNAMATAMVAYEESLAYAKLRPQGRRPGQRPTDPPVPIIAHADVRRMLLHQKAVCEGALALLMTSARCFDLSEAAASEAERTHARTLLELLTPLAKTFPAERGFEANVLAVQVLGGYGYTSEYRPEAWLRDQKLNSIHEGTTGIQSLDLLARKVLGTGGASLAALGVEIARTCDRARAAGLPAAWVTALEAAMERVVAVTTAVGAAAAEAPERALAHSAAYLDLLATTVVGWQWLEMAAAAQRKLAAGGGDAAFYEGKLRAARYWITHELPRTETLSEIVRVNDDAFFGMAVEAF